MIPLRALPVILALLLAVIAPPAAAQTVLPPYDPGAIPYEPRQVQLPACGFSMGLDPVWSVTEGKPGKTDEFTLAYNQIASSRWDRHPLNRATVQPFATLSVICETEVNSVRDVDAYLDHWANGIAAGSPRRKLLSAPVIDKMTLPDGPWRRIILRSADRQKTSYTEIYLLTVRANRTRWMMMEITEDTGRGELVPAGSDYSIRLRGQGQTQTRLLGPARRLNGRDGLHLQQARSAPENVDLAMRIAGTIR